MKEITPRTEPARLGLAHAALTGLILEVFYEVYNELGAWPVLDDLKWA